MENNLEILVSILSAGVFTAFVTGVFSLVISLKNNKKLVELEKIKHRHELDSKKYELLHNYMLLLSEKYQEFKPDEVEDAVECNKLIFSLLLEQFYFIEKEHEKHSYLFAENENTYINKEIEKINSTIDEFVEHAKNSDIEQFAEYVNNIALSIKKFADGYLEKVQFKIYKILNEN